MAHYCDHILGPGHYIRNGSIERRTALTDALEAAPSQTKDQRVPLMRYFTRILDMRTLLIARGRCPHPNSEQRSLAPLRFPKFKKLPLELREMVWRRALPRTRILEMGCTLTFILHSADFRSSHGLITDVAHACKESYNVVTKRYQKQPLPFLDSERLGVGATRFVDSPTDIIYLRMLSTEVLSVSHEKALRRVTRIAIPIKKPYGTWRQNDMVLGVFNLCDNLKQIIFVADEERFMAGMLSGENDFTDYDYTPKDKNLRLLPRGRVDLWEEKDHPFLSLYEAEIENLQKMLKEDALVEVFKGIEISFELWRRPTRSA